MEKTGLGEPRAKVLEGDIPEVVARRDGQFERRTFQMIDEDFQIVGLDESVLGSVAEEIVGMANNELIERRRGGHQHGAGTSSAAARASGALPGGSDGAGISGHDHSIEGAHINAQLERSSCNNTK